MFDTGAAVFENRLAAARLGIAAALFNTIRAKHPPLAAHGLRVAIGCSAWATARQMDTQDRERLEIAALLHDLGAISFPDRIFRKPGALSPEERMMVDLQGNLGAEIMRGCCSDELLLDIIATFRRGTQPRNDPHSGSSTVCIEARMLAIVEAYDAMTNDQVYRSAMKRDKAIEELRRCSGTQFDSYLVTEYCSLLELDSAELHRNLVSRWLRELRQDTSDRIWGWGMANRPQRPLALQLYQQVIEKSPDPTILIDRERQIIGWNHAIQFATGIPAEAVIGEEFTPTMIGLCTEAGEPWPDHACPMSGAIRHGTDGSHRIYHRINGTQHRLAQMLIWTLTDANGTAFGAAAVLRGPTQLEGLTSTPSANDCADAKRMRDAIEDAAGLAHQQSVSVLLVRSIEPIPQTLLEISRQRCRSRDLISLPEPNELAILWTGCSEEIARRRADEIETAWQQLGGSSAVRQKLQFHLGRIENGDTYESLFQRMRHTQRKTDHGPPVNAGLLEWLDGTVECDTKLDAVMVTAATPSVTFEKLRGFILERQAEILDVSENSVRLKVPAYYAAGRRRAERRADFEMSIQTKRREGKKDGTEIYVSLHALKLNDRRNDELKQCVQLILNQLRSYLMAEFLRG